jgi:hypothetical protein
MEAVYEEGKKRESKREGGPKKSGSQWVLVRGVVSGF